MKRIGYSIFILIGLTACVPDQMTDPLNVQLENAIRRVALDGTLEHFILPNERDYASIPTGVDNPLTPDKVKLGKMLFFETGLARDAMRPEGMGTYSCATCHVPSAGFMPGRAQGIADGGTGFGFNGEHRYNQEAYLDGELDVQGARPLSLVNVAYVTNTTWSGKFGARFANAGTESVWGHETDPLTAINHLGLDGLESQNMEGLHLHRMVVDGYVLDTLGYRHYYDVAFSDWREEERYGDRATSFAISAYIRTLLATEAPFQQWLNGDPAAMTDREKRGALVFFGKAGCYRCHQGPGLSSNEFYALGVNDLYQTGEAFQTGPQDLRNLGRGGFTGRTEDMYKFKVPGIYNMADSPFYFHGSSKRSLRELVEYFNEGIPENPNVPQEQIAPHFKPLGLTLQEINDLTAFLENGLRDPDLNRYVPDQVLSGNCFPNNDLRSKYDLGCN